MMYSRETTINGKLTKDEVKQIRQIIAHTPLTYREIGEIYNVTTSNIGSIKRGETWDWLN